MTTTIVESADDGANDNVQAAELSSVAAAGSAAGVAAVSADNATAAAEVAADAVDTTAMLAENAANAAVRAEDAAARASDAQYATQEQATAIQDLLGQVVTKLDAIAERPAPEPPSTPRRKPRDNPPAAREHFLRRTVGKRK